MQTRVIRPLKLLFDIDEKRMSKISYRNELKLDLNRHLDISETVTTTRSVIQNNRTKPLDELFHRQFWDIGMFNKKSLPVVIDNIKHKNFFQKKDADNNFLWLLDLPIKMPGINWKIPTELEQFSEFITKAVQYEKLINPNIENYYAYLSVDQRPVKPNESQRRPGWHADSFITKNTRSDIDKKQIDIDSIYLAYDCTPTEFCEGPFTFNNNFDHHNNIDVLNHFEQTAKGKNITTYDPFTILKMGPECVHRVGFNMSNVICQRTFIKLVFSLEIFNRVGNNHNYLIDYNWPLVQRTKERNNSNIVTFKDNDNEYINVATDDLRKIFFGHKYEWSGDEIYNAYRTTPISARPAIEGELLQTELDDSLITYNMAKRGDWKVKKLSNGTEYFLSSKQMQQFYEFSFDNKEHNTFFDNIFTPKPLTVQAVEVMMPIKIMAPWNCPQYLAKGDFILERKSDLENDIYGIKKDNFQLDYSCL